MAANAPCPEESTVWAFVHAGLSAQESAAIRAHLDECAACRAVTAMLARALPSPAANDAADTTEIADGPPSHMAHPKESSADFIADQIVAGKYRVEERLGSGGMGYVVAALHQQLGTRVALKILHPRMMKEADARARFLREARVVARLKSPHVVRVFDVDTLDEVPFLVMELLEGNDLAMELRERGTLPAPEAVLYVLQAAHALAEAHKNGIVHRDLKPANMFLVDDGGARTLKLVDFGISKELGRSSWAEITSSRLAFIGTPRYMAPEQLTLGGMVDARTDIWGLGVVLYQLIAGSLPFPEESLETYVAAVLGAEPVPLAPERADVPRGLWSVIARCLAKAPEARYPSVVDLAKACAPFAPEDAEALVQEIVNGQGSSSTSRSKGRSLPPAAMPAAAKRGKRFALVAAGGLVVLAVAGFAIDRVRRSAAREEVVASSSSSSTPANTSPSPVASAAPLVPPAQSSAPPPPAAQAAVPNAARAAPASPRGSRPAAQAPHAEYGSRR